jgi:hypothetical protein
MPDRWQKFTASPTVAKFNRTSQGKPNRDILTLRKIHLAAFGFNLWDCLPADDEIFDRLSLLWGEAGVRGHLKDFEIACQPIQGVVSTVGYSGDLSIYVTRVFNHCSIPQTVDFADYFDSFGIRYPFISQLQCSSL